MDYRAGGRRSLNVPLLVRWFHAVSGAIIASFGWNFMLLAPIWFWFELPVFGFWLIAGVVTVLCSFVAYRYFVVLRRWG